MAPLLLVVSTALAAGGEGGHGAPEIHWDQLAVAAVNLVLFVGILVWAGRRPIADALANRTRAVRQALDEAARLQDESQARFSDVESKLVALDRRIEDLKAEAAAEAEREEARLRERAEADARRIRESAERTIREEADAARAQIRGEAARMAVKLAEDILRRDVNPADQERLAREFLAAVNKEVAS